MKEEKRNSLREWIPKFIMGEFDSSDVSTAIKAGWYDWFCSDKALQAKTHKLGKIVKKLKDGGKIDLDTHYVWFKNNCPMKGNLYDDIRFAYLKGDKPHFVIRIDAPYDNEKYSVYDVTKDLNNPVFATQKQPVLLRWLNNEGEYEF